MRPASIIFLIISLILIITGSVICGRATKRAKADNFDLTEQQTDKDGNSIRTYPLTKTEEDDTEILKLSVKLKDVDVVIEGGKESSYVEVQNKGAIFNCYKSNKVMTVSNIFDLAEMIESSGSNFEFNGIRKYMDFSVFELKETKVFIYLSNSDPLKQIELQLENCSATMKNIDSSVDIISEAKNANLTLQEIKTDSHIQIKAEGSTITATDLLFAGMKAECTNCKLTLDETNYSVLYPIGYTLSMEDGSLTVNGAPITESSFAYASTTEHHFEGIIKGGQTTLIYSES